MQDRAKTEKQLEQLKAAYTSGIKTVKYEDSEVTYQSMTEMKKAINRLEKELGHTSGKITLFTLEYDKGL